MADSRAIFLACPAVLRGLVIERLKVEPVRCHLHPAIRNIGPFRAVAVAIDLDAVAFRVVEIDRLADEMVRCSGKRHVVVGGMRQPAAQFLSVGHEEGRVEQARCGAWRAGGVAAGRQRQERAPAHAERLARCGRVQHRKAHRLLVEGRDHRQVDDVEMRMVDKGRHVDGMVRVGCHGCDLRVKGGGGGASDACGGCAEKGSSVEGRHDNVPVSVSVGNRSVGRNMAG